jgi:membrane-bound lytic murein transglycosylase A
MMIAGDTGAPIRGAHRADVYFGTGPAAEAEGGRLYESGIAWQLVPTGWLG